MTQHNKPLPFKLGRMFHETSRDWKYADFKQEWNHWEHTGVLATLRKGFKRRYLILDCDDFFGLPYTSSGAFAGIWNTNDGTWTDSEGRHLDSFMLTKNNVLLARFEDDNENGVYYRVDLDEEA